MTSELAQRIWFTIGALLVYRLGTHIPLPGVDTVAWARIFRSDLGGLLALSGIAPGGGVQRLAVFALGLTPFLSAAIILQLVSLALPLRMLRSLPGRGEAGRARLRAYTLGLTIVLTVFQAFGVAGALEDVAGIVTDPGWLFRLTTVFTLTGGSMFLVWLCGQITARGVGNGIALILLAGVIVDLPATLAGMLELGRQGLLSTNLILGLTVLAVALTALIVFMELAQRRIVVTYPGREVGRPAVERQAYLPFKLNNAGVIPAILTSWLATLGQPHSFILYALALVFVVYVYTAWVVDPEQVAESLNRHGGVIAGILPGEATAEHVDHVVSRITLIGAAYLAAVMLIPELLVAYAQVPFHLGGTSLLIVVCAILDLGAQLRGSARENLGGQRP